MAEITGHKQRDGTETNNTDDGIIITADGQTDDCPKQFEDVIEDLGSFGHWQRVIFLLICVADIFGAFAMLLPVITGATPNWSCASTSDVNCSSSSDQCWCHGENSTSTCDNAVFTEDFTSIVSEWNLVCAKSYVSDLITSIQMAGLFVGVSVFGQISDTFGRKPSYYLSFAVMIFGGLTSAFAPSPPVYAACRAVVGVGFGGMIVVNCVYPLEFVGRRWRTICGTVGFWAAGGMGLALMGWLCRDWRTLTVMCNAIGAVYLLTWWFVPESPRWLLQNGDYDQAKQIVAKIAMKNGKPVPDMAYLIRVAEDVRKTESKLKKYTYLDLFRDWKYCRRSIILFVIWFVSFVMYYEMAYNVRNFSGDRYLNMFIASLLDLFAMLSVILLNNRLGRRRCETMFMFISLICNMAILILYIGAVYADWPGTVMMIALVGKSSALGATYVVQIFTAELFPTSIRNIGMGVGQMAARIGGTIAPQLVYLGFYYEGAPYVTCTALCLIALPLVFLLPETTDEPLEDAFVTATKNNPSDGATIPVTKNDPFEGATASPTDAKSNAEHMIL